MQHYEMELDQKVQAMKRELDDEIASLTLNVQPPAYTARTCQLDPNGIQFWIQRLTVYQE
jgi:hypothetical protein